MHPAALVACGGLVWAAKNIAEQRKKNPRGLPLPPGPKGLPVLGNLFQLPQAEQWKVYQEWSKQYGDMVYLEAMGQPILILGTLDRTEDLMEKHATMYSDRPTLPVGQFIDLSHSFAMMNYGADWRHDRRVFHQYLNHNAVVQYHPIMEQEAVNLLRRLTENPEKFRDHVRFTLGSIIMRVAYGFDDVETNKRLVTDAEALVSSFTEAIVPGRYLFNSFPSLGLLPDWFPGTDFKQKFRDLDKMNYHMLSSPFETTKNNLKDGNRSAYPNMATDLIDKLQDDNTPSWIGSELVARNVCGLAYLTGADTTVSSAWALVFALAANPEVQKAAQEEIDRVVGNDRLPQLSDREHLPYVAAVVKETSRWHSVVPLGLSRASAEDSEYNGYFIPKGTYIMMNTWAFMHDPEVFENPMEFKPERYLKDGEFNPNILDPEVAAFGYGRRICPGRHLSNDAIFLLAASLLAVFDITPAKDESGKPVKLEFRPSSDVVSDLYVDAAMPSPSMRVDDRDDYERELWKKVAAGLQPDPVTGRLDNNDILTFMREHENDPDLQHLLENSRKRDEQRAKDTNLDTYDYAALAHAIEPLSLWRIRMEYQGLVDPDTEYIIEPHELKEFPKALHTFRIFADVPNMEGGLDEPETRLVEDFRGLPKSSEVLLFIKKVIALPISCFRPALPSMLIITHQFEPHRAVLAPFLDSLPSSQFTWEIETAEMAEHMGQILYAKASHFYRQHKADGERHKEEGNAAFRRGDRKGAIAAYTQALRRFEDAHCQKVLEEDKKVVMKLMALTIANRSAAAVSPGEGQDIELAINDGKKAILANPHYAKGYARLAKAHQVNGELSEAQEAIAEALRLPELENEVGLVDMLIDLQTNGKGLPEDDEEFKAFVKKIFEEDKESAERVKNINGLWRKCITERNI